ncbi:MAG: type II toxin-antitoxin system PemK/MazF family toxin [Candidatus Eremiobacteraeota bacterium]|nr:type II toxin-antitoxin system PemK/MazF family toxin [Candidatus Eremiobacteraeota bacterium]
MKRGDVYRAELVPRSGSEQRGVRPVIIVSHDGFNETPGWRSVIVVPLSTSPAQAGRGPTAIPLAAGTAGLGKDSIALCHQVTTLDRSKLTRHMGALSAPLLALVEKAMKIVTMDRH